MGCFMFSNRIALSVKPQVQVSPVTVPHHYIQRPIEIWRFTQMNRAVCRCEVGYYLQLLRPTEQYIDLIERMKLQCIT